ncbi:uncharacterized protein [Branchiostoma lanceolatum]|uniref:uncharacterized protein n=1 Tax=Branchiostoma lanceolatum TaxID=7740 RepID=UPI0034532941
MMALRPEEPSTCLAPVVNEMTEAIATLRDGTGDVLAVIDNIDILEAKVHVPYLTYATKSQKLYLGDRLADIGAAQVFTSNIQWLRGMEHGGFSEDVWPYLECLYACCLNYSNLCQKFAEELGKAGIIPVLVKDLDTFKASWATDAKCLKIARLSLGTLHNMSRVPSIRPLFSDANAIGSLIPYLQAHNDRLKTSATLTLAYVINKEENLRIVADTSVVRFIIEVFTMAVDDATKKHLGFRATELAMGVERLAVNDTSHDDNKQKLVAEGVLTPLSKLMTEGEEDEKIHAIKAITQLAFHRDNREKIRPFIPQLKKFKRSGNSDVAKVARGALWQLEEEEERQQKVGKAGTSRTDDNKRVSRVGHVMLSYQWDDQEIVKQIKSTLQINGYKVWMDIDQMGGSTLEAMAGAVENAAVVLICMSRKYKESANCRRECEYAGTRSTDIIPLKMEDKYKPDGWLGITIGASLYFNFDGKDGFEIVMARLIKEIGDRGKEAVTEVDAAASERGPKLHNWTQDDIKTWVQENQLEG